MGLRITMETKLLARLAGIISIRLTGVGSSTIHVGGIILKGSVQIEELEVNVLCIAVISLCFLTAEQSPHVQLPQAPAPRTDFPSVISPSNCEPIETLPSSSCLCHLFLSEQQEGSLTQCTKFTTGLCVSKRELPCRCIRLIN